MAALTVLDAAWAYQGIRGCQPRRPRQTPRIKTSSAAPTVTLAAGDGARRRPRHGRAAVRQRVP